MPKTFPSPDLRRLNSIDRYVSACRSSSLNCFEITVLNCFLHFSLIIGKLLKNNCGEKEGKQKMLKIFQCVKQENVNAIQACTVGSLDVLKQLSESNEAKATLLPKMCCLSHVSAQCTSSKLSSVKCADPSLNPKEHIEKALRALQEDAMEIACADYKNIAACEAKIPDAIAQMKASVHGNTDANIGDRSLIQPLLKVAEKIAD